MKTPAWALGLAACVLLGVAGYWFGSNVFGGGQPAIEVPTQIELGPREYGQMVVAKLSIANRGTKDLFIDKIRTNCACSGLEQIGTDGQPKRLESLRLVPGQALELQCRLTPTGRLGMPHAQAVILRTNDPARPEVGIRFCVSEVIGGFYAVPSVANFGRVLLSQTKSVTMEIWDSCQPARKISHVLPSHPDQFSTELHPADETAAPPSKDTPLTNVGKIEVKLLPQAPRKLEGFVQIFLDDPLREPQKIPVRGEVHGRYSISPARGLLGPTRREIEVICEDCLGQPFAVHLHSLPDGIEAEVVEAEPGPRVKIRLRLTRFPDRNHGADAQLRIAAADAEEIILLPLFLRALEQP